MCKGWVLEPARTTYICHNGGSAIGQYREELFIGIIKSIIKITKIIIIVFKNYNQYKN